MLPTTAPARLKSTVVAAAAAVPLFFTVADNEIALVSFGDAGVQVVAVTTRSGLGAGVPTTWSSATCAPGAPLLAVKRSRRSATRPVTGIVTVFCEAGVNV